MKSLFERFIFTCICLVAYSFGDANILFAQVQISHQVIGSTGNFTVTSNGTSVSSTVGESAVTTLQGSNNTLTQGFQQPASSLALKVITKAHKTSCNISKDGYAVVSVIGGKAPYSY